MDILSICSLIITLLEEPQAVSGNYLSFDSNVFSPSCQVIWCVLLGERKIINTFAIRHCCKSLEWNPSASVYLATKFVLLLWEVSHMNSSIIGQDLSISLLGSRSSKCLKLSLDLREDTTQPHKAIWKLLYLQLFENQVYLWLSSSTMGSWSIRIFLILTKVWHCLSILFPDHSYNKY
jgi:hypothetical protein